jgi:hypothetical protein
MFLRTGTNPSADVVQVCARKIYDIPYVISTEAWRRNHLYCAGKSINIVKEAYETEYITEGF